MATKNEQPTGSQTKPPRRTKLRRRRTWVGLAAPVAAITVSASLLSAPADKAAAAEKVPSTWSYDRAATYGSLKTTIKVPTRDKNVSLGCDLYRPGRNGKPAPGRFPGLVAQYTPYYSLRQDIFQPEGKYFAAHGYNTIVCNIRGTGDSGGVWKQINSPEETRDNYDLIEWLARQPWSNGRIGQQGESYGGFTSYRVAALRPPHLLAIAPQQAQSSLYGNSPYPGGIWAVPGGTKSPNNWPGLAQPASGNRINAQKTWDMFHSHPTQDAFWDQIAVETKLDRIKVPILATGGWNDLYFRKSMVENFQRLPKNTWITYGQWEHTYTYAFPGCEYCDAELPQPPGALLAWWDHWLQGRSDAPLPAKHFTSYQGPVGTGAGWHESNQWPPSDVRKHRLHLASAGKLSEQPGPRSTVSLAEPGRPDSKGHAVTFTSAPLKRTESLAGEVALHLNARLSAKNANFHVQLLDVAPDGKSTRVNDGYLLASHRFSDRNPKLITPGRPLPYDIKVWPQDWRFAAGHKLRIVISGGDPAILTQQPPVTVSVETGSSYADFPFRG